VINWATDRTFRSFPRSARERSAVTLRAAPTDSSSHSGNPLIPPQSPPSLNFHASLHEFALLFVSADSMIIAMNSGLLILLPLLLLALGGAQV